MRLEDLQAVEILVIFVRVGHGAQGIVLGHGGGGQRQGGGQGQCGFQHGILPWWSQSAKPVRRGMVMEMAGT